MAVLHRRDWNAPGLDGVVVMWGWLFIALGAFATATTWAYAVREQAIVFSAAMATLAWAILSLQPEIVLISQAESGTLTIELGAIRWLLASLAMLSILALFGAILGVYPEKNPEQQFSKT